MKYTTANLIVGRKGESQAVDYLKKEGYDILERNYKNKIGEIDIIAFDKDRYVFVEVKTRQSGKDGFGREVVTQDKLHKIKNIALLYLKSNGKLDAKIRFDVIELTGDTIQHLKAVC